MIELEEARERILREVPALAAERTPVVSGVGRIMAAEVVSPVDLPGFDNSAMDGYAVRARDVGGAGRERPARLGVIGRVAAGSVFAGRIGEGETVRLFTGSPLPDGADAVVMQEDTAIVAGEEGSAVDILDAVKPWENVRLRGGDVARGAVLVRKGERISGGRVGLLSAAGIREVDVGKRPRVALLATGSELREPGEALGPGQIYESNRASLSVLVRSAGGEPTVLPICEDSAEKTRRALAGAFAEHDAVITSGGVSVGEFDFVKRAFEEEGGELGFWKVAIKPGKPFVFGKRGELLLFGLPGNPVSAWVTFWLLVRPALLRYQGMQEWEERTSWGLLGEELDNRGERRHWMRVRLDREGKVWSAGLQVSHGIGSLAAANGLVEVPPKARWEAGRMVRIMMMD